MDRGELNFLFFDRAGLGGDAGGDSWYESTFRKASSDRFSRGYVSLKDFPNFWP